MNYACVMFNEGEYGLTARMCTVKEFYDTVIALVVSKAGLSFPREMWAAPSLDGCYYSDSRHLTQCSEVGSASLVNPVPSAVSCGGWTSDSSSQHGTVVKHMDAAGSLTWNYQTSSAKCSSSLPVACCAP